MVEENIQNIITWIANDIIALPMGKKKKKNLWGCVQ